MEKRIPYQGKLVALLVLALLMSACATGVATPASSATSSITTLAMENTPTAQPSPSPPATKAACPPLDADIQERMRLIESQVSQLRGLEAQASVQHSLLTRDQLAEKVELDLLADYSDQEAVQDARLLLLLGLIEPDVPLRELYLELLGEQVAGFYDSEAEELVIVCDDGFSGVDQVTYAHEYVHVLQDQVFDLEAGLEYSDEACQASGERCFALQALIEGDASLLQEQWLRTFGLEQVLPELLAFFDEFEMPVFDAAPTYIQAELTFPYLEGLTFTRALYLSGGWAAVDAAYRNPPVSSEQILHPDRYPRDLPVTFDPPDLAGVLGSDWSELVSDSLGEWVTRTMLQESLEPGEAVTAAEGWGGDFILVYESGDSDRFALVLLTQWDTVRDAREFADAFGTYGDRRFGEASESSPSESVWHTNDTSSRFLRKSNQTLWLLTPDADTLALLSDAITLPIWPTP